MRQSLNFDLERNSSKPKTMHFALIAFQLLGTGNMRGRPICEWDAVDKELCGRIFVSGWALFCGSIVGACVFHWLTQHVRWMHGWWERASTPIGIWIIISAIVFIVLVAFVAPNV